MSTSRGRSADPTIPNIAGKVMTVAGPIYPGDLGATIMHEHLFIDLRPTHQPPPDATATEVAVWQAPLSLSNLHLARTRQPLVDNYLLSDEATAIEEALEYKRLGGGTIVDVTSIGLRRDPLALTRVAAATGLNVVMGAGWYQKAYHPADMDRRTVEDLAEEIIRDVTVGVGDTGVRSGIIGEVGINGDPLTENEVKSIRAAARASRATGATISFHRAGNGAEKHRVLDLVGEEGGDLSRVVLGHSDEIAGDIPFMIELLDRGPTIEFDLLGRVQFNLVPGNTIMPVAAVPKLIEAGFEDKIVLSQDVCNKFHLKSYGGTGYSFILEEVLPHLRSEGVTEAQAGKIMVENPARMLTFVAPG